MGHRCQLWKYEIIFTVSVKVSLVWIFLDAAGILVTPISATLSWVSWSQPGLSPAVWLLVTEELPGQTLTVPALQQALLTHRLRGLQVGLHQAGLGQLVTVGHLRDGEWRLSKQTGVNNNSDLGLPVTNLLAEVEGEAGRAPDGGQADGPGCPGPVTPHHVPAVAWHVTHEPLTGQLRLINFQISNICK